MWKIQAWVVFNIHCSQGGSFARAWISLRWTCSFKNRWQNSFETCRFEWHPTWSYGGKVQLHDDLWASGKCTPSSRPSWSSCDKGSQDLYGCWQLWWTFWRGRRRLCWARRWRGRVATRWRAFWARKWWQRQLDLLDVRRQWRVYWRRDSLYLCLQLCIPRCAPWVAGQKEGQAVLQTSWQWRGQEGQKQRQRKAQGKRSVKLFPKWSRPRERKPWNTRRADGKDSMFFLSRTWSRQPWMPSSTWKPISKLLCVPRQFWFSESGVCQHLWVQGKTACSFCWRSNPRTWSCGWHCCWRSCHREHRNDETSRAVGSTWPSTCSGQWSYSDLCWNWWKCQDCRRLRHPSWCGSNQWSLESYRDQWWRLLQNTFSVADFIHRVGWGNHWHQQWKVHSAQWQKHSYEASTLWPQDYFSPRLCPQQVDRAWAATNRAQYQGCEPISAPKEADAQECPFSTTTRCRSMAENRWPTPVHGNFEGPSNHSSQPQRDFHCSSCSNSETISSYRGFVLWQSSCATFLHSWFVATNPTAPTSFLVRWCVFWAICPCWLCCAPCAPISCESSSPWSRLRWCWWYRVLWGCRQCRCQPWSAGPRETTFRGCAVQCSIKCQTCSF